MVFWPFYYYSHYPATNFSLFTHILNVNKFWANLVTEFVLLSTSVSLALLISKFLADLVVVILSIKVTSLALLKPLNETLIEISKIASIFLFFIYYLLLKTLKINTLESPVVQIPLFSTRNYYERWVILTFLTVSSSFIINFFDNLIGFALGLKVVMQLFYLSFE